MQNDEASGSTPGNGPPTTAQPGENAQPLTRRQRWMGALARADTGDLATRWSAMELTIGYVHLRAPEVGMVMVCGRTGGTGSPFNLGEMTVTRASVQLEDGTVGHSYVAGRRPQHAECAALLDALLMQGQHTKRLETEIISPLLAKERRRRTRRANEAAATKVDFFTMVRSE